MFADFAHFEFQMDSKPNCQRSRFFPWYKAKPDLRHLSDQSRLDPEPGRTPAPRMGLVRLSRDTQHMRLQRAGQAENRQILCKFSWGGRRGDLVSASSLSRTFAGHLSQQSTLSLYPGFLITYLMLREGGRFPYVFFIVPLLIAPIFSVAFWERMFFSPT